MMPRTQVRGGRSSVVRWRSRFGLIAFLAFAPPALAEDDEIVTVREITIVGRIQKPVAAVDVSRIQPKMALAELRQPFLDRIEKAIYRAPF